MVFEPFSLPKSQNIMKRFFIASFLLAGCPVENSGTELSISNDTSEATIVYVSFGSDSAITASDWDFCVGSGLNCSFELNKKSGQDLPLNSSYINATFSFGEPVGCGVTKVEVNLNNPSWYDTMDVSLVDGFSNKPQITYHPPSDKAVELGLPNGESGNEDVLGLFPLGCDICVERQDPPCGISKGKSGCKAGTQYDPHPPCQYQGAKKGGGGSVEIQLKEG